MDISKIGYIPTHRAGTGQNKSKNPTTFEELLIDLRKRMSPIRVRHILVMTREEAERIKKQIDQGADFATLARSYSICPSRAKGGDLGYFGPGQMVKPFEDASFALDHRGDISDIVKTQFGYHLIRLEERIDLPIILRKRWMLFPQFRERFLNILNATL